MSQPVSNNATKTTPRRRSRRRKQVFMFILFLVLSTIIAGYWYLTDSRRVRAMAERYLSEVVGGRVTVKKAHLSIFEGLRLEDVDVYVDDKDLPDSRILSARLFEVKASPRALLKGRLDATQILAVQPVVYVCENVDKDEWNFGRLRQPPPEERPRPRRRSALSLPQLALRGGSIEYSRIERGQHIIAGKMNIDGQLTPDPESIDGGGGPARYNFDVEIRPPRQQDGPRLVGTVDLDRPTVVAQLEGLDFNSGFRAMLPSQVRQWWEQHEVGGSLRVPRFRFTFGRKARPKSFEVEVQLDKVQLTLLPKELLSSHADPPRGPARHTAEGFSQYEFLKFWRPGVPTALESPVALAGTTAALEMVMPPQPLHLQNVSGRFVFTEDHIRFSGVRGRLEGNMVALDGRIEGYSPRAAGVIQVAANNIVVPRRPPYLMTLPYDVRREIEKFRPAGRANLMVEIRRDREGGRVEPTVTLSMLDGEFCFEEFMYPLRNVRGTVRMGRDPKTGFERVDLIGISGNGLAGTKNENYQVKVDGWISPLNRHSRVHITVRGEGVTLDQELRRALPPEAQDALAMFDQHVISESGNRHVKPVELFGDFRAELIRDPPGKLQPHVYLSIRKAAGAFSSFAYPLENLSGEVEVHPNVVHIRNVVGHNGPATLYVDGQVEFGKGRPTTPTLSIRATNVPMDTTLLGAFEPEQRKYLEQLSLGGTIQELSGRIYRNPWIVRPRHKKDGTSRDGDEIQFDIAMKMRDGRIWMVDDTPLVTEIAADVQLTRSGLKVLNAIGKRGQSDISATGEVTWAGDRTHLYMDVKAKDLFAGPVLYGIVPDDGRQWWDQLRIAGVGDLDLIYDGYLSEPEGVKPTPPKFDVKIRPRSMTVNPVNFSWPMDIVGGEMRVTEKGVTLTDILLRRADGQIKISGKTVGDDDWQLAISADRILVDDELRTASPKGIRDFLDAVKLRGFVGFTCDDLSYRSTTRPASRQVAATTRPMVNTILRFKANIRVTDGSMDVGMPITAFNGGADLGFDIRNGDLYWMGGTIQASSLLLGGRPLKDLHCTAIRPVRKPNQSAEDPDYVFKNLSAKVAGGALDGRIDLATPDNGPSRYAMRLILNEVNIVELVGEKDAKLKGLVSGRLDLEGAWGKPNSQRGSGRIEVRGQDLYRMPLMFGLLQIANLSLPIKKPFNEASVNYAIEGSVQRVIIDKLELKSANIVMIGKGQLDFATKKVEMVFNTEDPGWSTIPMIGPILNSAKRGLFEFRVTGTIQEPQIKSGMLNTITTTIDDALSPPPTPKKDKDKKKQNR